MSRRAAYPSPWMLAFIGIILVVSIAVAAVRALVLWLTE